ncbi:hypothetical protein ONN26_24645, partial [Salmonella enterica subsp. enterica serovar Muenster]|nr:hypothetical protein [Salmonella enterica subsp. enterica serovar Muenster]
GEDCGSTQHILLLDEFYRTAVRLAGKRILWSMVPCDEEEHYDRPVGHLLQNRPSHCPLLICTGIMSG